MSENVKYCTISITLHTKKIFQRKFLKQWRGGNRLVYIYCVINKIRGIDLLPKDTY